MSIKRKTRSDKGKPKSEEHKKKISYSLKGKPKSEQTKKKMSEAKKMQVFSDFYRKSLSDGQKKRYSKEEEKIKTSNSLKGRLSERKGKTLEELYGSHKSEKIKKKISSGLKGHLVTENQKIKVRQHMLNGGAVYANFFIKNPSKPQVELFKMLQQLCPNPIMNYPIYYRKRWNYSIDIADPKLGLAFEYDEPYWHKHKGRDSRRQKRLEELGWKFLRYEKLPIIEQLKNDINTLLELSHDQNKKERFICGNVLM